MKRLPVFLSVISLVLVGRSALLRAQSAATPLPATVATKPMELRGVRYCEVLAGRRKGLHVELDVYNTIGLGSCPQELWEKLDAEQLRKELGVSQIKLNGPRYWTLDRFSAARLLSTETRSMGGIPMRIAGRLELTLGDRLSVGRPYVMHKVRRDTVAVFDAGRNVFELIDSAGNVFDMQSYSVQKEPQSETTLQSLGMRLHWPKGWSYRTRTLTAELRVVATGGYATVVQDDLGNTYQKSLP